MTEQIQVVIDTNAGEDPLTDDLLVHEDISSVTRSPLDVGDVLAGNVLIERKDDSDLVSSIVDDRLFDQAERLRETSEMAYILVEGDMRDFRSRQYSNLPQQAVIGSVASVMTRAGIPVVFCSSRREFCDLVARLGRKSVDENSTAFSSTGLNETKSVVPTVAMLTGIPGIGATTAEEITSTFPTIESVCLATEEELTQIEGVGSVTAETILQALSGELD